MDWDTLQELILSQLGDSATREAARERLLRARRQDEEHRVPKKTQISPAPARKRSAPPNRSEAQAGAFQLSPRRKMYWIERVLSLLRWEEPTDDFEQIRALTEENFPVVAEKALRIRQSRTVRYGMEEETVLSDYFLRSLFQTLLDAVTDAYDPDVTYPPVRNSYFSYVLGARGGDELIDFIHRLLQTLPEPTPATWRLFGYDEQGRKLLWWDPEGVLRSEGFITEQLENRLAEPQRMTSVFWKHPVLVKRAVLLFDRVMDVILQGTGNKSLTWRNPTMKSYLRSTAKGNQPRNRYDYRILQDFLRLAENRVRQDVADMSTLQVQQSWAELTYRLPPSLLEKVTTTLKTTPIAPLTEAEMAQLPDSGVFRHLREKRYLALSSGAPRLAYLSTLDEDDARKLLSHTHSEGAETERERIFRVTLMARASKKPQPARWKKQLAGSIHFSQWEEFLRLVQAPHFDPDESGEPSARAAAQVTAQSSGWAQALDAKLAALSEPRQRKLHLETRALKASRKSLAETVAMVDAFLSDARQPQPAPEIAEVVTAPAPQPQPQPPRAGQTAAQDAAESEEEAEPAAREDVESAFVGAVVAASPPGITREAAADWSASRGLGLARLVTRVNEKYFDALGAQIIYEEDGFLTIDPLDADWWREEREDA